MSRERGWKKKTDRLGKKKRAKGEMTLMVMRWRKVWRGIKTDHRQREGEIDL